MSSSASPAPSRRKTLLSLGVLALLTGIVVFIFREHWAEISEALSRLTLGQGLLALAVGLSYPLLEGVSSWLIALCALPVVQRLARWLLHFLPDTGRWAERRESWLKQLDTLSTESRHLLADKPRCAAILGVHLVKLFLLFCLPWMGLRFMELDTGLTFWQVQLLTSLTLFVSNALPNVAGMGSVETAFLLVYSSFLPDASSMSLLMFYRLASYYAVFAASAVGFALAQRRLNRG